MADLINTVVIRSPGIDPGQPHIEDLAFTDAELVQIKCHISQMQIAELPNDDAAVGFHKLLRLIIRWQENSP